MLDYIGTIQYESTWLQVDRYKNRYKLIGIRIGTIQYVTGPLQVDRYKKNTWAEFKAKKEEKLPISSIRNII